MRNPPDSYPVYWNCEIGRDRASFLAALVLLAAGASNATVMEEFALSASAGLTVNPECIQALLDEIGRRGGVEAYLASIGVSAAALEVLRAEVRRNPQP